MHVRQQVRNAVTSKLREIKSLKGSTHESMTYPLGKDDMPAALVFSEEEVIETVTKVGCRLQRRHIETAIYVFARADKEVENVLDPLVAEVENKIYEDQTLGRIAEQTQLSETNLFIGGEPKSPVGAARLSFISTVYTKQGDAENAIINSGGPFS